MKKLRNPKHWRYLLDPEKGELWDIAVQTKKLRAERRRILERARQRAARDNPFAVHPGRRPTT